MDRNPSHTGDEACNPGIHINFETKGRREQKLETGVSVAPDFQTKKFGDRVKEYYPTRPGTCALLIFTCP